MTMKKSAKKYYKERTYKQTKVIGSEKKIEHRPKNKDSERRTSIFLGTTDKR